MTERPPDIRIVHDAARQSFRAVVDGLPGRCDYRLAGRTMLLVHTEVHPALEGRGIAGALVQAAVDHARAEGMTVQPLCSYVRAWLRRHPQHAEGLVVR